MSEIKVNKITPKQNCTQVTLGDSGDTFVIPSGVTITNNGTQTGFGRTGTVDWDTTAKTAGFTAVSGNGYFVNTTSGAITVTLPASPSAGDIVYVKDYTGTFATNSCTIARNGSNIRGAASDFTLDRNNSGAVFIYVDATEGWQIFVDGSDPDARETYTVATGGTVTCCGNYKIHTFTGPGTFTVCSIGSYKCGAVDYMVVAGGGGGGGRDGGGGGGAGGFREGTCGGYTASPLATTALPITVQGYPITVGGGGTGGLGYPDGGRTIGTSGSNSIFSTITSAGGGFGASYGAPGPNQNAANRSGGSGGGGGGRGTADCGGATGGNLGGSGNTPPVSPSQGNNGGNSKTSCTPTHDAGGGGGGATAVGSNGSEPSGPGGAGGAGATTSISGTPTAYAGGGGGGSSCSTVAPGGTGGGGAGADETTNAVAGTTNRGGGGGGGGESLNPSCSPTPTGSRDGKAGGSGIVIIRYKFQ